MVYGNTKALLDSKIGDILEDNDVFDSDWMDDLREVFDIDGEQDLSGNISVWADPDDFEDEDGPVINAVIYLDNGNAEDIFDAVRTRSKKNDYFKVKKDVIDGCDVISVYRRGDPEWGYPERLEFSLALVDRNILQLTLLHEIEDIYTPSKSNELARKIDRSAVAAAAGSPKFFRKIWRLVEDENPDMEVDVDGIGAAIVEIFVDDEELEIKGKIDISELEVEF